ncbi:MAG: hypothetical protein ACO3O6_13300, partial [Gemmobacter sp.]
MLGGLIERLLAPAPARLGPPDAAQALAVLLVRLARADGDYEAAEVARIDRVLGLRLGRGGVQERVGRGAGGRDDRAGRTTRCARRAGDRRGQGGHAGGGQG